MRLAGPVSPDRRLRLTHAITLLALVVGAGYLLWRLLGTQTGAEPWLFWPLLAAEAFGWVSLALFAFDAWVLPPIPELDPLDVAVDILVPTYNESHDVLEATLVGCAAVRGDVTVWVLDDGHRPWVRELAESFGFRYVERPSNEHAKAGNINHALPLLTGELVLVLDADHVPMPHIVTTLSGYFRDPDTGLVQSPHFFRNRDSVQHQTLERHEQSLFFEVLLAGRQRNHSVFWCGSGAMLRLSALRDVGGVSTRTVTEDLDTSMLMQRRGHRMLYHNEMLVLGLAPHNLAAYLLQRDRWAQGTLRVLLGPDSPVFGGASPWRTRLSYVSNLFYYLLPLQRITYAGILTVALVSGLLPVGEVTWPLMVVWLAWTGLGLQATRLLSRGKQRPSDGSRNAWITASAYIRAWVSAITGQRTSFRVTPKEGLHEGGLSVLRFLWLPTAIFAMVAFAVLVRVSAQVLGALTGVWLLPAMPSQLAAVLCGFAAWELWTIAAVILSLTSRRQMRHLWRFPVELVAQVDGSDALVMDIHEGGARVKLSSAAPTMGQAVPLSVQVQTPAGVQATTRGMFTPRRVQTEDDGSTSVGGTVEWASARDRRAVIYQTYVAESMVDAARSRALSFST